MMSATDPMTPPAVDDWDKVCHQANPTACPTGSNTTNATAVSWTDDGSNNATIFTGGGSKDPIDVNQWAWKDGAGGLPDKDNLQHAFAARYSLPPDPVGGATACPADLPNPPGGTSDRCEVLFFGSDRFDNSGDAQQGFWFFQNKVTLSDNKLGGGTGFAGVHKNGDLLVISDFSNGGTTSTITIYQWDSSVSGNLRQLQTSDAAKCAPSIQAGDAFCGIVNPNNGTAVPWSFTDKSGNHTYLNGELYEAGLNLSHPDINLAGECFTSFLSETRSSTSTTATLKDFVLGQFAVCKAELATTPSSTTVSPKTPVHDTATVTGNQPGKTPSGTVTFFMCSFAAGTTDTCDDSDAGHHGSSIGTGALAGSGAVASADSPNVNTVASPLTPGRYCFRAEWPGDINYVGALKEDGSGECFTVSVIPTAISTAQSLFPNDSATVSTSDNSNLPSGSVSFKLYNSSANCTANGATGLILSQTRPIAGGSPTETVGTTNTTIAVPPSTTLYWRVSYTTSSSAYEGRNSNCTENTTLTITDDPGPGTAP